MTETELGKKWARKMRREGAWIQKLPASSMAGLPDWLANGRTFIEAKRRYSKATAYKTSQLTNAQKFFLRNVVKFGGRAAVLILAKDGYVLLDYRDATKKMSGAEFDAAKESYR